MTRLAARSIPLLQGSTHRQATPRRATVMAPVRASRSGTVRVVAFRDTHRSEQLINAATDFSHHWLRAQANGVSSSLMEGISELTDPRVELLCHDPPKHSKHVGMDELQHFLDDHKGAADLHCCDVLLSAANESSDTVFVLLGPNKAAAASSSGQGQEKAPQYQLLKLDFLYDDGARNITTITHRSSMGAGAQGAAPLPLERLTVNSTCMSPEHTRKVASAWCCAHSSGHDAAEVLKPHLAPSFQLWDAYGHPTTAGKRGGDDKPAASKAGDMGVPVLVPPKDAAMDCFEKDFLAGGIGGSGSGTPGAACSVEVRLLDHAACMGHAASFSHWIMTATGQAGSGTAGNIVREGMQVEVYDPQGKLTDVWSWRDATPQSAPSA